jgi:hypothetical protein
MSFEVETSDDDFTPQCDECGSYMKPYEVEFYGRICAVCRESLAYITNNYETYH